MLVFLIAFSAFCFSAMVQMAISILDIASNTFALMILVIGLILAFMILLMSLSNTVKGNAKTIAMMRVFGNDYGACADSVLGTYRPFSYIGFAVGTVYQYGILKLVVGLIFSDVDVGLSYSFNFRALPIALAAFIIVYELIMHSYTLKIKKLPLKTVMIE